MMVGAFVSCNGVLGDSASMSAASRSLNDKGTDVQRRDQSEAKQHIRQRDREQYDR